MPASDYAAVLRAAKEALKHFLAQVHAQEARAKDRQSGKKGESTGYDPITLRGPEVGAVEVLIKTAEQQQEELAKWDAIVDSTVARLAK